MSDEPLLLQEDVGGQKLARTLLAQVALCLKLAGIHELSNAAMEQPLRQLVEIVNGALEDRDNVRLQVLGESVFLNNEIIKLDYSSYEAATSLRKVYDRLQISEVAFNAETTENHLRAFLQVFQKHYRSATPGDIVNHKIPRITVRAIEEAEHAAAAQVDARENLMRTYARLIVTTGDSLTALENGKPPRLARLRRAVHALAQASLGHSALLIALTRMEQRPGELATHLASVAAMTLVMMRRLKASRKLIGDCCMAALLHDVARNELDSGQTADVTELVRQHDEVAVEAMLRICRRNITPQALGLAVTAFECSRVQGPDPGNGLARLIAVPCAFDLMTSAGLGQARVRPDHAMRLLFNDTPERFDLPAVRLFAQSVGLIPVGTAVRLTGGEIGIVMDIPDDDGDYDRPRIKVVADEFGNSVDYVMDLAALGHGVAIVGSVDARDAQVNVPHFLLS